MSSPHATFSLKRTSSIILILITALVLLGGLFLSVNSTKQKQNVDSQASEAPHIFLKLQPVSNKPGQAQVDITVNTGIFSLVGDQVRLSITGAQPSEVRVDTANSLYLDQVGVKILPTATGTDVVFSQFAALDRNKAASTRGEEQKIASLIINKEEGGTATIKINEEGTIFPVIDNAIVTLAIGSSQSLNIQSGKKSCNQNCATDTECQSSMVCYKGSCRSSAKRDDQFCGNPPDQGLHRTCNEYCADTNECQVGYTCYYNRCRNPKDLVNKACIYKPVVKKTVVKTATASASLKKPSVATISATQSTSSTVSAVISR